MRLLLALVAVGMVCFVFSGCAGMYSAPVQPGIGWLYSDVSAPLDVDNDGTIIVENKGEASAENILGWIVTGDASIAAAARAGKITKVRHVDYKYKNILGIYAKFTTVVYGE